mgnify:CR=1 FL=1
MTQITISRKDLEAMSALAKKHGAEKFFMAKDEGAYVDVTGGSQDAGNFENHIVYFKGMNPKTNEDAWDNARYAFGGDDFGEHFDIDIIHKLVADPLTTKMVLKVGKSNISISSYSRPAAKAAPKPAAPKAAPTSKGKQTIGSVATSAIKEGLSNDDVLQIVKSVFPNAKTTNASINWYRSQLNKKA